MNSRAKKKLSRSWQDRDWNRNRRCWYRLPVPLYQPCWVLIQTEENQWQIAEKELTGFLNTNAFGIGFAYYVRDIEDPSLIDLVSSHDLFESFEQASQETERRNRPQ